MDNIKWRTLVILEYILDDEIFVSIPAFDALNVISFSFQSLPEKIKEAILNKNAKYFYLQLKLDIGSITELEFEGQEIE
jgi:hypothetical protein